MKYANLGGTGISVSRICLGMMTYGSKQWRDWVLEYTRQNRLSRALSPPASIFRHRGRLFQRRVGGGVGTRAERTQGRPSRVVIATKCNGGTHGRARNRFGLSRKNVVESCDASLKRLHTDYIDLYQITDSTPRTPIEETIDALNELVRSGKARYLGASSMFAWQMAQSLFTQDRGTRRGSSRCRTTTTWCIAKKSAR